jgi:hypothetical protein
MKTVYRFVLLGHDGTEVMSTEVDECDPSIDAEFWNRFLEGDCVMLFCGEHKEEVCDE